MKLRLFFSITIFLCLFASTHVIYGVTLQSAIISGNDVNVRTGPGLDTDIIGTLQQGLVVNVVEQSNEWLEIQFGGQQTGWVYQQFVKVQPASENEQSNLSTISIHEILDFAQRLIGISYVYGGASLRGFDCSGFTMFVLSKFGIQLPHEASQQMMMGLPVPSMADLIPGDLVFFRTLNSKIVNHVGIYLGDNLFIHAASGFGRVRISALNDNYYSNCYAGARRLVNINSGISPG